MKSTRNSKSLTLYSLYIPVLVFAIALAVFGATATLTSRTTQKADVLASKSEKSPNANSQKSAKTKIVKTQNASEHKKVLTEVVSSLEEASQTEEEAGNTEASQELEDAAEATDEAAGDTLDAIDEVEAVSPFKKLIVGPDYKNLGQLRSSIAHTQNTIRKLTKVAGTTDAETNPELTSSLAALELEKARLYGVVTAEESRFSLFGWLNRLLYGYTPLPIGGGTDTVPESTESSESTGSTVED